MLSLKCTRSMGSGQFLQGKIYPVHDSYLQDGRKVYSVKNENGHRLLVPLDGAVWNFELIEEHKSQPITQLNKDSNMKFLKCVGSSDHYFTAGKIYPASDVKDGFDDRSFFYVSSNEGIPAHVPLQGQVWQFEEIEVNVDQMYFNLSKNEEIFSSLIQAALEAGFNEWSCVEEYTSLIHPKNKDTHVVFYGSGIGINGGDICQVTEYEPREMYEVSGEIFLQAFLEKVKSDVKKAKPRYHRKRKPMPKRTVAVAKIYYIDGSTYTVKHIDKVTCHEGRVSLFGRQSIADGVEDVRLVKINANHVRSIVVKSPSQTTQIECDFDFSQGNKWNVRREKEQILRAAQISVEV